MNVMDAIRTRRSVRKYDGRPIPDEVMQRMKDALRLAPSACNYQPWRFVLVSDPALRKELARAANGQDFIADAPVIVVGVGLPDRAYKRMGGRGNSVDVDLAIALDHLTLAAVAEGLGTCWRGVTDERELRKVLSIPDEVQARMVMLLGYPDESPDARPRKPLDEVVCYERYTT